MATTRKVARKNKAEPNQHAVVIAPRPDPLEAALLADGRQPTTQPDDSPRTIQELAVELLKHPDEWLDHPNPQFGGRTPNDLIGTEEEGKVYNLLRCAELGLF